MNIPLNVPASQSVMLKDEASQNGESTLGILKNSTGEISATASSELLTSCAEEVSEIAINQIFYGEGSPSLPAGLCRHISFLSNETLEIECQVTDLMRDLEKATIQTSESSHTGATVKEHNLPQCSGLPQTYVPRSIKTPNCSKVLEQQTVKSSEEATPTSTPQSIFTMRPPQIAHSRSTPQPQLNRREQVSSPHSASAEIKTREETIYTSKSHEGKQKDRNNQQEGHQQQKREQQEESLPSDKEEDANLSVAHLRFSHENRPVARKEEKTFKKKLQSPMRLFASSSQTAVQAPSIENVFVRFMRLMARILGQAEAEAHELYLRVKERTDNVDSLTLLLSKINAEPGTIDWNANDDMKSLVERAKQIGVTIPSSGYTWNEAEKKLLKENIQMCKEGMEKITQLERTDMQRLLQEVSQCHQARSNVLKLMKELMDTFIYNMRP